MRKLLCLTSLILLSFVSLWAQDVTTLTFAAKQENNAYQKLDSVVVTNVTKGWTEVLAYPDTVLEFSSVGIHQYNSDNGVVKLYQNTPNPFQGETDFRLVLNHKERVNLVIFDMNGKKVAEYQNVMTAGEYLFRTTLSSPQTYLLSAVTKSGNTSIKMINLSSTGEAARIQLVQSRPSASDMFKRQSVNPFAAGDNMKYIGYATQKDGSHNIMVEQQQMASETITFVFPTEVVEVMTKVAVKEAKNITTSSVDMVCEMTPAESNEILIERGICWGEEENPVVGDNHLADTSLTTREYTLHCQGLTHGTTYHFRAYANTSNGMTYSKDTTVTLLTAALPTLKIDSVYKITEVAADVAITIISNGNMEIKANGVIFDTLPNPVLGPSALQINSKENSFVANLKNLKADHTYYVKAYAQNDFGLAYSEQMTFKTAAAENKCPSVKDVEGHEYKTVLIGSQCWMAEDLIAKKYSDGTAITSGILEYTGNTEMGTVMYYNWATATRSTGNTDINNTKVQGACPTGWHIPSYGDYNELCKFADKDYVAVTERPTGSVKKTSNNGLSIKLALPKYWQTDNAVVNTPSYWQTSTEGFNTTGFSARAIGYAKSTTANCPGTAHYWTAVGNSAGGRCDVFKIVRNETGIIFQNASSSGADLYGVRCIKDAEGGNTGGGGGNDDPEDTISWKGKYVIFSEQATRSYQIYDITDPSKPVWQWRAQQDGGYTTFNNPSDVKPVYNGTCIMAVASGGGAAIVRIKDKKVLFYANVTSSNNPHSIELLPNNRVVVASSTGNKLTVYTIDTNKVYIATKTYERYFDCGHNVVWDEGRKCLWSAGKSNLEKMTYNETTGELTTIKTFPFPEGNNYAHDFIKIYGKDQYHMTTEENTYVFDPNKETFTLCEGENTVNVKSISSGPEGYPTICAIPLSGYGTNNRTWVTKYVLNFDTGAKLMEIPSAEIYKLRWWLWEK